jgi:hypothetical protein
MAKKSKIADPAAALRIHPQGERWSAVGVAHRQPHLGTVLDEHDVDLVAEPGCVPVAGPDQVGDRDLDVVDPSSRGAFMTTPESAG